MRLTSPIAHWQVPTQRDVAVQREPHQFLGLRRCNRWRNSHQLAGEDLQPRQDPLVTTERLLRRLQPPGRQQPARQQLAMYEDVRPESTCSP